MDKPVGRDEWRLRDIKIPLLIIPTQVGIQGNSNERQPHECGAANTALYMEDCAHGCDGCQSDTDRYRVAPAGALRELVLVAARPYFKEKA